MLIYKIILEITKEINQIKCIVRISTSTNINGVICNFADQQWFVKSSNVIKRIYIASQLLYCMLHRSVFEFGAALHFIEYFVFSSSVITNTSCSKLLLLKTRSDHVRLSIMIIFYRMDWGYGCQVAILI